MASEPLLTGDPEPERLVTNHCPMCEAAAGQVETLRIELADAVNSRDTASAQAEARWKALEQAWYYANCERMVTRVDWYAMIASAIGCDPALLTGDPDPERVPPDWRTLYLTERDAHDATRAEKAALMRAMQGVLETYQLDVPTVPNPDSEPE